MARRVARRTEFAITPGMRAEIGMQSELMAVFEQAHEWVVAHVHYFREMVAAQSVR